MGIGLSRDGIMCGGWGALGLYADEAYLFIAGTNEEAIVNVLGYRSVVQRQDICTMYKTMFGKVRVRVRGKCLKERFGQFVAAMHYPGGMSSCGGGVSSCSVGGVAYCMGTHPRGVWRWSFRY